MPNTAFPKLRFRASRAVNHVDDEPAFSRDAAMSGKILMVAAARLLIRAFEDQCISGEILLEIGQPLLDDQGVLLVLT